MKGVFFVKSARPSTPSTPFDPLPLLPLQNSAMRRCEPMDDYEPTESELLIERAYQCLVDAANIAYASGDRDGITFIRMNTAWWYDEAQKAEADERFIFGVVGRDIKPELRVVK